MRRFTFLLFVLVPAILSAQSPKATLLPNGWSLTPAGQSIPLSSDLPLNMAFSPDGVHLAVTNNGNGRQTIDIIGLKRKRLMASVPIHASWLGLAFAKRHPYLYVSGGNDDIIIRYQLTGDTLISKDTITLGRPWPLDKISPTGLTLDEAHDRLYVVTKENNALYICDTRTMTVTKKVPLSAEAYTVLLNPATSVLYISAWGGRKIWIFDTEHQTLTDSVSTDDHPNDMAVSADGRWLYVANANANSVSVINAQTKSLVETLHTALSPDAPIGSTTNSVCLSGDEKTLYIANADNNYLAVFDVADPGHSRSLGFIPVGWYPTCVRTRGREIFVTNGKGLSSLPNPGEPQPGERQDKHAYKKSGEILDQYVGSMLKGTLSVIPTPAAPTLAAYTAQVYANTPYSSRRNSKRPASKATPSRAKPARPRRSNMYSMC